MPCGVIPIEKYFLFTYSTAILEHYIVLVYVYLNNCAFAFTSHLCISLAAEIIQGIRRYSEYNCIDQL